ncbi:MAG: hemolysin III family protein [Cucumibacter sp.]
MIAPAIASSPPPRRRWHRRDGSYSILEVVADAIVHGIGITASVAAGSVLLALALGSTGPGEYLSLVLYLVTLLALLSLSMSYNLVPPSGAKRVLGRLDEAAIFLFIAGTYTPFLALLSGTTLGTAMIVAVWSAALIGVALKLIVPKRFGRLAILLYLGIGWSGVVAFGALAAELPPASLVLLLAGGAVYSAGIVFHLWERLRFHNVVWHVFVVTGAMLHLGAVFEAMVISRP